MRVFENQQLLDVAKGLIPGQSIIHKFGAGEVTTVLAPVSQLNKYTTPTAPVSLEVLSDDANDTTAGSGAREITVTGLDENWEEISQVIATNGVTAVVLPKEMLRVYRWYVSKSGTYASAAGGSHAGNLTVQVEGGGATWDTIPNTPTPVGQSQIGAYTIPKGQNGYLLGKVIFTDTAKLADVYMFKRENADEVIAPYTGIRRMTEREVGVQGGFDHHMSAPKAGLVGPCDIGFLAKVSSGTAEMSVEFELLLIKDGF